MIDGSADHYAPLANACGPAEAIAGAKRRVLENAGHLVFIERFAEANRKVARFLKPRDSGPSAEAAQGRPENAYPGAQRAAP